MVVPGREAEGFHHTYASSPVQLFPAMLSFSCHPLLLTDSSPLQLLRLHPPFRRLADGGRAFLSFLPLPLAY